ncbi:unnamed protein product [Clonostachys chloroleuca]|uniref:37S ribosomal protein S25, mitochondrial n=1 Tax=Clonostachys chloroleuca TaxID=1926264 RepID=A0AA35LR73_9HYPO|nr:unnamed protein product [Clonostachys chloroleuca]
MGVKQIRPARVYKAAENELRNRILQNKPIPTPPWFEVVNSVPPSENAVRTVALRHRAPSKKATKPRNLYRPQQITYPEDSLRSTFYKDHPWELARPRNIVETDGRDAQRYDWSRGLRQRGMQLSGESVVQRQLWLMENQQMGREKAYDQARREFYRLRQEEEIERRVALEEAKYVGAYFGKSRLDVGLQLENAEYEKWKVWAAKESERREALLQESRASDFEDEDADVEALETPGAATESLGAAESR